MSDFETTNLSVTLAGESLPDGQIEAYGLINEALGIQRADIEKAIQLRVGNRPFARSMTKLFKAQGKKLPADLAALAGECYLIVHSVGIVAERYDDMIRTIGYQAEFDGQGNTIELLPATKFHKWISGGNKFEAGLAVDGHAKTPSIDTELTGAPISLGGKAELRVSNKADLVGNISMALQTAVIQAVGQSSSVVTWQLDQDDKLMVGDQTLLQTVMVPSSRKNMSFKLSAFAVVDAGWFRRAVRLNTPNVSADVVLAE